MAAPKINIPGISNKPATKVENPFACETRKSPPAGPKNITPVLFQYLPLDKDYSAKWVSKNLFGMPVHKQKLEGGKTYQAYDGKRLIFEVGCDTIIYLNINPKSTDHHKFFIQPTKDFFFDITDRLVAAKIVSNTAGMVKIIKYEMYFLMGLFSTVSLASWLAVTGSDVTYLFIKNKTKVDAAKKLSATLITEMEQIKKYAPTLHKKLSEFISNEKTQNAKQAAKDLPQTVATDEKVQGQVSGILYGKYVFSATSFTVWAALSTVLVQAFIKSATKSLDALSEAVDKRYASIIRDLRNVDWDNMAEVRIALDKIIRIFKESKVPLKFEEAQAIFMEVKNNANPLEKSLTNIFNAFTEFQKATKEYI